MRCVIRLLTVFLAIAASSLAEDQKEYLPLKVGNEWTMNAEFTSPKGDKSPGKARRKVEEKVEREGKTYFRTRTKLEGGPTPMEYTKLVRRDETGLYSIVEAQKDAKEQQEILLPLKEGLSWQTAWGSKTFTNTVIALEAVKVAGKTYENCYHIRTEAADKSYREDFWEAPKVGNIKSEVVYENGGKLTLTLREFKAGK